MVGVKLFAGPTYLVGVGHLITCLSTLVFQESVVVGVPKMRPVYIYIYIYIYNALESCLETSRTRVPAENRSEIFFSAMAVYKKKIKK